MLEQQMQELRHLPTRVGALESQVLQLRQEMHVEFSAIRAQLTTADEETRTFMRILHEDVLARFVVTDEGNEHDR